MSWLLATAVETPGVSDPHRRLRWLRTLARLPGRSGRDDFAWWDLTHAAPWVLPTALGTVAAALPLVLLDRGIAWAYGRTSLPIALGSMGTSGIGTAVAVVAPPLLAGLTGRVPRDARKPIRIARSGPVRIGIAAGGVTAVLTALEAKSWSSAAAIFFLSMLMFAVFAWTVGSMITGGLHKWLARVGVAQDLSARAIPRRLGLTFTWSRVLLSLAVAFLPLLLFALSVLNPLSPRLFPRSWIDQVLGGALIAALTLVLLSVGKPSRNPRDHRSALIGNAMFGATTAILATFATFAYSFLYAWLMSPTDIPSAPLGGGDFWSWLAHEPSDQQTLVIAFLLASFGLIALGCAMVGVLASSAGRYALNLVVLSMMGRLPWRLDDFLTWSHEVGILRKSGQTYSFRHESIRRYLDNGAELRADDPV